MGESRRNIIFLLFLAFAGSTSASIGKFLPFSGFYPIPSKTPEPININTFLTYPIITFQHPLTFAGNNGQEDAYLQNIGTGLLATLKQNYTTNVVMGGPLGKSVYTYIRTVFRWTNVTNGVAYSTINGKNGSPLEVLIIFYNQKYKSYTEALNYRDGLVKYSIRIHIGSKSNPAFKTFAKVLKKIKNPGAAVSIKLYDIFSWYYNFPFNTKYYVYPGSFTNSTSGMTDYCTTTIISAHNAAQFISQNQFDQFLKLRDSSGQQLITSRPQHPQGFRPVARARGIRKSPTFNKKTYPSILGSK